ncbi:hypothetical protein OS493_024893 [Desmophyllum pertusum]|uniref:SMB domain-containing protein n=1 Tax=Desmophyllum pertusum TaxID=174260 RepID=A0A9W9YY03_9CNID|nr:hypothetical protein OS493_024893 [Desmophyllum pertusum]
MWTVKTSSRSAIFSFVFVCLTILTCCSSMPKQIDKEVGRFGYKMLRYPVYPPKLENDENAVAKLHREKPHMNTLLKDFPGGYDKRRIRRDIAPSHLKVLQQDEDYEMPGNCTENVPSHTPPETPPFTTALPTLNDKDVNITMHCESYWFSCRGRCTGERELGGTEERLQCFCDNSCEMFKDCCADFDQFCSSSGTSAKEQNNPDNEQWKCVESDLLAKALGVWMISSCPSNWTQEEVEERCTSESEIISYDNHKDNLPVIDRKGNTYKNHYCAQCHGSNLRELLFYNLQFNCDVPVPNDYQGNQILKSLFSFCSNSNIVYWQPPEGVPRRYCHRISPKQECGTCSFPAVVQQKCLTGSLRLVYLNDNATPHNFFNPYCALIISNAKNIGCGPRGSWPLQEPLPNPFSIVIDLDFSDTHPGKETSKLRKHKVSCCKGNVYDFYLQVCRPGIRPSDLTSLRSQIFSVSVWMRSNISYLDNPLTKLTVKEAIVNKLNIKVTLISDIAIGNHWGPVSTIMFNIKINRTLQKTFSAQTLQTAMSSLSIVLNDANFTTFKVVVKPFNCAVIESFNPHEYTFERNAVKITKTGKIFQENDFYTNEAQWINGSLIPIGILTVCKQPRLNCSGILVGLNENEYVILSNGSLYRNISRELFEPRRFKFINDTIWVVRTFLRVTKLVAVHRRMTLCWLC